MLFSQEASRRAGRLTAAVCACALAMAAVPFASKAFADDYSMDVEADVSSPQPVVIRVEVPSSGSAVDILVRTSVIDGRFLGFQAAESYIKNLDESTAPISATVSQVVDGAGGKGRALQYLGVFLSSDRTVELVEGSAGGTIVDRLEPGNVAKLKVSVVDRAQGRPIPEGSYGMSATIKVSATR